MFKQAWQCWQVNVSHLVVFDERDKEPEGYDFRAMQQESSNHKVHALDVVDLAVVIGEGCQYSSKLCQARAFLDRCAEVRVLRECP